jgi:hypothetical protein
VNYTTCKLGTRGKQCSLCSDGFYKDNTNCFACADDNSRFWILLGITVVVISLGGIVKKICKLAVPLAVWHTVFIGIAFWQLAALLRKIDIDWPQSTQQMFGEWALNFASI